MKKYDRTKLVELWNVGKTIEEISEELGVSKSTVIGYVQSHRKQCNYRNVRISISTPKAYDECKLVELWNEGVPVKDIAKEIGISVGSLNYYVNTHRELCVMRYKKYNNAELIKLWDEGKTMKEIAKLLSLSEIDVSNYIRYHRNEFSRKQKQYDEARIVELWDAGKTVKEIVNELGIVETTVKGYISRYRKKSLPKQKIVYKKYDAVKLIKLWDEGVAIKDIAKELDVPETTVTGYLKHHRDKCSKPWRHIRKKYDTARLVELWNDNVAISKIAEELHVSEHTIISYAKRHRDLCPKRKI